MDSGIVKRVNLDNVAPTKSPKRLRYYQFKTPGATQSPPSPYELLQAYDPDGVLCYFTAIALHELSTQRPVHHHIASLANSDSPAASKPHRSPRPGSANAKPASPLGTYLFESNGLPYFKTSRQQVTVPGVQLRYLGPLTVVRVTTLAQTLLDTLHRPLSCGGPAVVMECWESGLQRRPDGELAAILAKVGRTALGQRLGYLLGRLGRQPQAELAVAIERLTSALDPRDPATHQQLFPGVEYRNFDRKWCVYGPA